MGNVGNCLYLYTCMINDLEYCFAIRKGLRNYYRELGRLDGSNMTSRFFRCDYEVMGIQVKMGVYCPKVILNVKIRKYYRYFDSKWCESLKPISSLMISKNHTIRRLIRYHNRNRLLLFGLDGCEITIGKVVWELDDIKVGG